MDSFLLYALAAGLGIALLAGPLGSFVVWRKMAYFGVTLSHACLFGIALGILLQVDLTLAVVVCCLAMAMLLGSFDIAGVDTPDGGEAQELMGFVMSPIGLSMRLARPQ